MEVFVRTDGLFTLSSRAPIPWRHHWGWFWRLHPKWPCRMARSGPVQARRLRRWRLKIVAKKRSKRPMRGKEFRVSQCVHQIDAEKNILSICHSQVNSQHTRPENGRVFSGCSHSPPVSSAPPKREKNTAFIRQENSQCHAAPSTPVPTESSSF